MSVTKRRRVPLDIERITTVALELFNEHGFDGTSMDEIAVRLGVTKPALYYHAPGGKEEILRHAIHRVMDPLWMSLQEPGAVEGSAGDRLKYVLTRQVELILQGMPEIGYFLLPVAHHHLKSEVRARRRAYDLAVKQLFTSAVEEGVVRADLDTQLMLRLVLGMGYSMNEWYLPGGRLAPDEIRDTVLAIVLQGISVREPSPE